MRRDTPNLRYAQDWACPKCGRMLQWLFATDRQGRTKRITQEVRRPEKDGPWGPDDRLEERYVKRGNHETVRAGREWVHVGELLCPECGVMSRGQAVRHEFSDDELPRDFYTEQFCDFVPDDEIPAPTQRQQAQGADETE